MTDETKTEVPTLSNIPAAGAPPVAPKGIPRSRDAIRVDYTNTCAQLGQLHFQRTLMKMQEQQLMGKLNALSEEEDALPAEVKKLPPPKLVVQPPKAGSDGTA